jgi:hypothetical protein
MALVDEAIEASGGLARWGALKRFTLQLSIGGDLFSRGNSPVRFKEIVAQGCLRDPLVRLVGFAGSGQSGVYRPDFVTIEEPAGNVLRTWRHPQQAFLQHKNTFLDESQFMFVCGFSVWNYLTMPFILVHPGVSVEELSPWHEQGHRWRRLHATFPPLFASYPFEQTLYFDSSGLQQRADHKLFGVKVADYSWAHQEFCGLVIPTLRRSRALEADETKSASSSLIEVEIFDATFE